MRFFMLIILIFLTAALVMAQPEEDVTYTVERGDILSVIAEELDISLECLLLTNDRVAGDAIFPGDELLISADCPAFGQVPALDSTSDTEGGQGGGVAGEIYVVQRGDTLDGIAQSFDVSIISLQLANTLSTPLMPGTSLLIPEDAAKYGEFPALDSTSDTEGGQGGGVAGELYVVQPGDNLDGIAQEFDVSLIQLREANTFITSDTIFPGTTLLIPDDAVAYDEIPPLEILSDEGGGQGGGVAGELYVVQRGDNLDGIGQEYDVSIISLRQANNLATGEALMPGQTIVIPDDAAKYGEFPALDTFSDSEGGQGGGVDGELYVIQPLDNLDQIAANFNVTVVCITEANSISNVRLITPGQSIVIPTGCPSYVGAAVATPTAASTTTTDEGEAQPLGES